MTATIIILPAVKIVRDPDLGVFVTTIAIQLLQKDFERLHRLAVEWSCSEAEAAQAIVGEYLSSKGRRK